MIGGETVLRKVPVRFHKGYFEQKTIAVTVEKIDEIKGLITVSYNTDMFNNGAASNYVIDLPIKG